MNPLNSITGVWIAGVLLSVVLAILFNLTSGLGLLDFDLLAFVRWVHIIAGILWVGLLYYFNFVQIPAVGAAVADRSGPGPGAILKYVAPRALLWFRWASVVTWVAGAFYLVATEQLLNVFSLGLVGGGDPDYGFRMGVGAWLGTILLANVWLVIWPNQKKILGLVKVEGDAELAEAKRIVTAVARTNAVLSFPMLMFMVAANHGVAF